MSRLPFVWDKDIDEPTLRADAQDAGPCRISAWSRRLPVSAPASGCHCLLLPRIRLSPVFCDSALHSDLIAGVGLLTVYHVRHITSSSSWPPASVDTEHGAKPPKNPIIMGLSVQNDM